jgi:hypothetical protein
MSQTNCDNVSTTWKHKKITNIFETWVNRQKIPIECDTFNGICIALEISYKIITTLFGQ